LAAPTKAHNKAGSKPTSKTSPSKSAALTSQALSDANTSEALSTANTSEAEADSPNKFSLDLDEPGHWDKKDQIDCYFALISDEEYSDEVLKTNQVKMDERIARFEEKEHIHVDPVYLGFCETFKNMQQYPVTSGKLSTEIEAVFKHMGPAQFRCHELRDFFTPNPKGTGGYVPKKVSVKGEKGKVKMYDIDHVVPKCWGGLDHPRNYVVMHRSLNRSFRELMPQDKMQYIQRNNKTILRKVAQFVKEVNSSGQVEAAIKNYIENDLSRW